MDESAWKYKNILPAAKSLALHSLVLWDIKHPMDMGHLCAFSCQLAKS
jgi:hypothetical protein